MFYLNHREKTTKVLGPGKRYALWVQGCHKHCPGCIYPEGQVIGKNGYWISVKDLFSEIQSVPGLTGITISGGEPFLQPEPIAKLVKALKTSTKLDIMVYTGYTLAELHSWGNDFVEYILKNIDLLIDGEYIEDLNTNKIYRGSDNQVIHFLSQKYLPYKNQMETVKNRSLEFYIKNGDLFMVGIPEKNFQKNMWNHIVNSKIRKKD